MNLFNKLFKLFGDEKTATPVQPRGQSNLSQVVCPETTRHWSRSRLRLRSSQGVRRGRQNPVWLGAAQ